MKGGNSTTSMLVTNVGDQMCWRQLWDVGDSFDRLCHQHPLSFKTTIGHQHSKDVTNIKIPSPTLKNCHQHLCSREINNSNNELNLLFQSISNYQNNYRSFDEKSSF